MKYSNLIFGCVLILVGVLVVTYHRRFYLFCESRVESRLDRWFLGSFWFYRLRLGILALITIIGGCFNIYFAIAN